MHYLGVKVKSDLKIPEEENIKIRMQPLNGKLSKKSFKCTIHSISFYFIVMGFPIINLTIF